MPSDPLALYVDSRYLSPYALSAFVALREKGLSFKMIPVDLQRAANLDPGYARTSLTQRVPTLVHGDFALSESSAIDEYVEETFPGQPLYPVDRQLRARARQVQAWLRSDLVAIRNERPTSAVFLAKADRPLSVDALQARDRLFAACRALIEPGSPNLCGEWSIADVDLALMLQRLVLNGDEVPAELATYASHQWQRPSVREWVSHPRS